jgi:hypothetical protein
MRNCGADVAQKRGEQSREKDWKQNNPTGNFNRQRNFKTRTKLKIWKSKTKIELLFSKVM